MDCIVPNCQCSCHIKHPQEINIKELMIQQLEKEAMPENLLNQDYDDLWARRVRIHKGEEKPLSYDNYKNNFPKLDEIKQTLGVSEFDNPKYQQKSSPPPQHQMPPPPLQKLSPPPQQQMPPPQQQKSSPPPQQQKSSPPPQQQMPPPQQQKEENEAPFPKAVPLNPLHKYKISERDIILRDVYYKALNIVKNKYTNLDTKSKEFNEYVNKEADNQLEIWFKVNKN
jgi:hypothetical protein